MTQECRRGRARLAVGHRTRLQDSTSADARGLLTLHVVVLKAGVGSPHAGIAAHLCVLVMVVVVLLLQRQATGQPLLVAVQDVSSKRSRKYRLSCGSCSTGGSRRECILRRWISLCGGGRACFPRLGQSPGLWR